jgi:hypothetical protein
MVHDGFLYLHIQMKHFFVNIEIYRIKISAFFHLNFFIFSPLDPDPDSQYGSGSTKSLNPDPIRIRIHNPGVLKQILPVPYVIPVSSLRVFTVPPYRYQESTSYLWQCKRSCHNKSVWGRPAVQLHVHPDSGYCSPTLLCSTGTGPALYCGLVIQRKESVLFNLDNAGPD